jgi:NTE family protein
VLGAGGTVGHAYQAGTLAALAEAGWDARDAAVIVGTSIGALTGALLRAGLAPADLYARVIGEPVSSAGRELLAGSAAWSTIGCDLRRGRTPIGRPASLRLLSQLARQPWRTRAGLLLAAVTPTGPVPTEPLVTAFNRMLDGAWPDQTLWVCAVDLDDGRRVILGPEDGPAIDVGSAVAASSAVPSLFEPVIVDGRRLVDGGLHSPANADVLADAIDELEAVVVLAPMGLGSRPGRTGVDLPGRFLNHWLTSRELRRIRQAGVPVTVFEPGAPELEFMHYDAFDLSHRVEIARRAHDAAAAQWAALPEPALLSVEPA